MFHLFLTTYIDKICYGYMFINIPCS